MLLKLVKFGATTGVSMCAKKVAKEMVNSVQFDDATKFQKAVTTVGKFAITSSLTAAAGKWASDSVESIVAGYRVGKIVRFVIRKCNEILAMDKDSPIPENYMTDFLIGEGKVFGIGEDKIREELPGLMNLAAQVDEKIHERNLKIARGEEPGDFDVLLNFRELLEKSEEDGTIFEVVK